MQASASHRSQTTTLKKKLLLIVIAVILAGVNYVYQGMQSGTFSGGAATSTTNGDTIVHFIDVGQGDSELILSGTDAILIDAGPNIASQTVISYLEDQGVTHLNAVIATHPHEDHIGGMDEVINNFKVDTIYMPNAATTTKTYGNVLDAIDKNHVTMCIPTPGDTITLSTGATLRFLSPDPTEKYENLNNYSLVTLLSVGSERALFMGDAEKEIEEELLRSGFDLSCDVLKTGHHGSHSSSSPAFLKQLDAKIAVISCGTDNSYGHPHEETLVNLQKAHINDIRRTDESGTIVLTFPISTSELQKKEASAA